MKFNIKRKKNQTEILPEKKNPDWGVPVTAWYWPTDPFRPKAKPEVNFPCLGSVDTETARDFALAILEPCTIAEQECALIPDYKEEPETNG